MHCENYDGPHKQLNFTNLSFRGCPVMLSGPKKTALDLKTVLEDHPAFEIDNELEKTEDTTNTLPG